MRTTTCTGVEQFALTHDVQGNVISKAGRALGFDFGNQLRGVAAQGSSPASSYLYDGWRRRVRDTTTASRDRFYGKNRRLTYARDQRSGKTFQYIHLNGSQVAEIATPIGGGTATTTYIHTDALGTPTVKTSHSKAVIEKTEIEPYGNVLLPNPASEGPGYTGHLLDTATNLSYMQQRYYDPMLGQFLSNDPVYTELNTGANFNRRWYANGNPYTFTDPDGRRDVYIGGASDKDDTRIVQDYAESQKKLHPERDIQYFGWNETDAIDSALTRRLSLGEPLNVTGHSL